MADWGDAKPVLTMLAMRPQLAMGFAVNESLQGTSILPDCGVRPLRLEILSRRAEPPSLILASRRSRRRREARWAGDSSGVDIEGFVVVLGDVEVARPGIAMQREPN